MMAETTTIEKSFVINELLCYIQNNFASSTLAGLQTVISGFYTVGLEEITNAKSKLYEVVKQVYSSRDDLHVDDLPRFTTRRSGDNKRRLDAGDIIDFCSTLDTRTTNDIPQFLALDLSRIPPFQPDATDYCSLAASVEFLHGQMAEVMKKLSSHHTMFHIDVRPNTGTVADLTQPTPPPVAAYASSGVSHTSETSGSSSYAKAALVQSYAQQTKSHPTRIYGSKKVTNAAVKTIPRRLTAFVGRLHIDTTAEDLKAFLSESGLLDVRCTKLKPPTGREFKTAAFCVSCPATDGNEKLFHDECVWPEGVELRDWYFKEKPNVDLEQGHHQ